MGKSQIVTLLAIIVTLGGAIVMMGWIMDIQILKNILPIWVTMKFITAFSFFFSGIILYFVSNTTISIQTDLSQMILGFAIIVILLLMTTLLFSSVLNIRSGVEDFFIVENIEAIQTLTPGRPSIGTMLNFVLVAAIGLITMNDLKKRRKITLVLGLTIIMTSIIAVLGYLLSIPFMYYLIEGTSTAMAFHTAILFLIVGFGFILNEKNNTKLNKKK